MAVTLELGQLCLSHPRAGLRLAANVLATASLPQTTNEEMASAKIPAALTSGSAWVCRGRGFHLALNVSVNGSPADSHLQQHLLNSICSADASSFLWLFIIMLTYSIALGTAEPESTLAARAYSRRTYCRVG